MQDNQPKIALFIDADNAPAKQIETVLNRLAKHGTVSIRKAYGNWKNPSLKPWEDVLQRYAIHPVQQFDLTKGKNATDMAMIIDAMDTLHSKDVDGFCIVSSDCDFTPLAMRIREEGKHVFGFGERKTPEPFRKACTEFLFLDSEVKAVAVAPLVVAKTAPALKIVAVANKPIKQEVEKLPKNILTDTKALNVILNAVREHKGKDGWAFLGRVAGAVAKENVIDINQYGFKKMGLLIKSIDLLDKKGMGNGHVFVRYR